MPAQRVWTAAEERKDLFKNVAKPGLTTIRGVLQEITGLRIDYTVIVDLKGFQSLVDAMGGVTVNVTERLPIQGYHTSSGGVAGIEGWIEPGVQQLDGYHALWFARSRLLSDDYSRMRRQRCLVGKILNQVNPATMVQKYPQLAAVAKENIQTDVPAADLPAWVDLVLRIKNSSTRSLTFTPDNISPANPNFAAIKRMVKDSLNPLPAVGPVVTPTTTPSPTTKAPTKTTGSTSNKSPKPSIGPTTPAAPPSQPVTIDEAC
ncbi:MAG: LCP family protein [Actinomycetales bacterium]|nr:LCP family protein [Actinomycetales bacterium]